MCGKMVPTRTIPITLMLLKPRTSILEGEMTLIVQGEKRTYRAGDRCDVRAGAVHSACVGNSGCRYLIGEK